MVEEGMVMEEMVRDGDHLETAVAPKIVTSMRTPIDQMHDTMKLT